MIYPQMSLREADIEHSALFCVYGHAEMWCIYIHKHICVTNVDMCIYTYVRSQVLNSEIKRH